MGRSFPWFSRASGVLAGLAAVVVLAGAARADTIVQFSTAGVFDDTSVLASPHSVSPDGSALTVGNTRLVYHAASQVFTDVDFDDTGTAQLEDMFGFFTVESTDPSVDLITPSLFQQFDGAQFQLTVTQQAPAVADNQNSWFANLSGRLWYRENDARTGSTLVLEFNDPLSFTIPPDGTPPAVRYQVDPLVVIGRSTGTTSTQQFGVGGQVAVPLPGVVWMGLALLGGVGGAQGLKRLRRPAVTPA